VDTALSDTATRAYLAGLFDGEGCVSLHLKKDRYFQLLLCVVNTHLGVLEFCRDLYGGAISARSRAGRSASWQQTYAWQICGDNAQIFAEQILPFTIIKTSQIEVFLEARAQLLGTGGHKSRLTPEIIASRVALVQKSRDLKRAEV
jgi:hypothetical protein